MSNQAQIKGYTVPKSVLCLGGQVTWSNNGFCTPCVNAATSSVIAARALIVDSPMLYHDPLVNVTTNSNTTDGGFLRSEIGGPDGNMIITVDQATGIFTLDTVGTSDPVAAQVAWAFEYLQGDNTIVTRSFTVEADFT